MTAERPSFDIVIRNGVRWRVAADFREQLFGPEGALLDRDGAASLGQPAGLPLETWKRDGRAMVVKSGPHRTVYRLQSGGLDLYLKHNRVHNARALLRQLVRPSKSRLECDHALEASARGVPTVIPIAVGETGRLWPGDSYLITLAVRGVEPLDSFLARLARDHEPQRLATIRRALARELALFVARMHDAGVRHNDLHAGNLLIRPEEDDRPQLFLIDLHAARLNGPLTWEACRDNLIMLGRWFCLRSDRSDRLRFCRDYLAARRDWGGHPPQASAKEVARLLEAESWSSNIAFWRGRDGRCLNANRHYSLVSRGTMKGHAVRGLSRDDLDALLADPDGPFDRPGKPLLKNSRSSTVAEITVRVNGVERAAIFKRFKVTTWSDPWVALIRPTGALRSWVMGQGFRERELPSPRPLAVLHRLDHGRPAEGYLLVEKVESATDVKSFVDGLRRLPEERRRTTLRRAIEQLARQIRDLHHRSLSHRDLKSSNILARLESGSQGESKPAFWFIDLVGVRRCGELGDLKRMQNLTRLHVSFAQDPLISRTEKLRFLRVYLRFGLSGRRRWKTWWRRIEQLTKAKAGRNLRVGRPLS